MVAADAGLYFAKNDAKAQQIDVKCVSIPSHSTKSEERRLHQKQRWFQPGSGEPVVKAESACSSAAMG
jgi:hypothetical protein